MAQQTRLVGSHECWSAKKLAQRTIKHPFWAIFRVLGELFRAYTMTTVPQGELFRARTRIRPSRAKNIARRTQKHGDVETDDTSAHPNKGPLKPPSPLHPKNTPKTPISHLQRRWRFQSHTGTSEQRRRWFQTTGPPGRQGQAAAPAGPEAMSGPAISHLGSLTRTLTR